MRFSVLVGLLLLGCATFAQTVLVTSGDSWKYLDNGSNQGTAWRANSFNDAAWASGPSELGYGETDQATVVNGGGSSKFITTYFRKTISLSTATFTSYTLRVKRDDGIVVYINGTERYRNNMPTGTISFTTRASATASDDGNTWLTATLPAGALVAGNNTIAVEIHQRSNTSSDITFNLELTGNGGSNPSCATATGLAASNIGQTSAQFNWGAVSGATAYNLQWKTATATSYTTISGLTTNSFNLIGLSAGTAYNVQVQAVCGTGSAAYSAPVTFTTAGTTAVVNEVIYQWSGALQPTSATVVAKLTNATTTAQLVVSTSSSLSSPLVSANATANTANNLMAKMNITGLQPATTYYYAVQSNGVVDNSSDDIGRFTTPAAGAFSYTFTVGSCAVNSNHQVYTAIQNKNPLFHLTTGDFHYANPNSTNISTHRAPYENNMLSQTPTRNLFKNTALAYMWDDHDYCGDNSSGAATGQANARQAYQEYVPHYPLVAGSGNVPIYQAFTIGRVRFILADLRSVRSSGTMMGTTQKAWFKNECINAKNNGQIIAWISSVSFGGNTSDNWGGFSAERTELSNFFRDNSIANLFVLSGDAHMVAIDNGTNHDFSTGNNNPNDYPVFQAAAINNSGSTKGGTYSEGGTFPNNSSSNGQYGVVEVTDNGGSTIQIKFTAYRTAGNTTSESVLTSYTFSRTLGLQPASFSVRTSPQSQSVITSWSHAGEPLVLEKSRNGNTYKKLMNISHQQGDYEDKDAVNGWNHYRLKNKEGKIISEKSVFVSGSTSLSLFPNPAKSQVNVMLKEVPQAINSRYMVYNDKMKTQLQGNLALQKGKNTFPLDISTLLPGIYYLHIVLQGAELTQKLVVQ